MDFYDYAYFLWALQIVVGALLLIVGLVNGVARYFPAFFTYVGYCLVGNLAAIWAVWNFGYASRAYGIFHETCATLSLAFLLFACAEAYRVVKVRSSYWAWAAMLATGLFLASFVAPDNIIRWSRLAQAILLHVATYFMLAILIQLGMNRDLRTGRNLAGILWSLALIVSSQYLMYASISVERSLYPIARWLIQPTFIIGVMVPVFYMRGVDLPLVQVRQRSLEEGLK